MKTVLVHIMAHLTVTPFRGKNSPGPYYDTTLSYHFVVKTALVHIMAQLTNAPFSIKTVMVHIMAHLTVTPFRDENSPSPFVWHNSLSRQTAKTIVLFHTSLYVRIAHCHTRST